jgi:hypothetical protein
MKVTDSIRPIHDAIRYVLDQLDAVETYAYSLWALPPGKRLGEFDAQKVGTYLQCAGSAQRMTIEMRDDSQSPARHWTIGRPINATQSVASEEIEWSDFNVFVFPNEVFDASEAAQIIFYYYQHGAVPEEYVRRPL